MFNTHTFAISGTYTVPIIACTFCGGVNWHYSNCPRIMWVIPPNNNYTTYYSNLDLDNKEQHPLPVLTELDYFESIDAEPCDDGVGV